MELITIKTEYLPLANARESATHIECALYYKNGLYWARFDIVDKEDCWIRRIIDFQPRPTIEIARCARRTAKATAAAVAQFDANYRAWAMAGYPQEQIA